MAVSRGCGCTRTPTDTRFTEDGTMEVSFDGGATWQDATSANDPRLGIPLPPPLPGADGDAKKCNASQAAVEYFMNLQADLSAQLGAGIGLTALGAAIALLFIFIFTAGTALLLAALFGSLAISLVGVTSAAFDAAFTAAVWDRLLCNFYCRIEDDGSFTEASWQDVKLQIGVDETGLAEKFLFDITNTMGYKGLTFAARSNPDAVGACGACSCTSVCQDPELVAGQPGIGLIPRPDLGAGWWQVTTTELMPGGPADGWYATVSIGPNVSPGCCLHDNYVVVAPGINAAAGNRQAVDCSGVSGFSNYGLGGCVEAIVFRSFNTATFEFHLTTCP